MRYRLTQLLHQSTDGKKQTLAPMYGYIPGDPEEAWKRRIDRLREQRLHRSPDDLQSIETGHANGVWWIEFSDEFTAWSIADNRHAHFTTSTRLEYEEVPG